MPNRRYHVHIACVADDPLLQQSQDDVSIFFEQRAILTKDLKLNRPESASYSWRCINACDAVLILIGNEYGKLNISGVSQLHVSYTNAKTKNKPILVFIHSKMNSASSHSRHLSDFVGLVQSQMADSVRYFDETTDFLALLKEMFDKVVISIAETDQEPLRKIGMTGKDNSVEDPLETIVRANKYSMSEVHASLKPALHLDNEVVVSCTAHAFKGGTLIEVPFVITMTWRKIVQALTELSLSFSEQGLARCLYELIDKTQANKLIISQYPDVHAVSRHQVTKSDVSWVQDELQLAGWIEPAGSSIQGMLWKITNNTKAILK